MAGRTCFFKGFTCFDRNNSIGGYRHDVLFLGIQIFSDSSADAAFMRGVWSRLSDLGEDDAESGFAAFYLYTDSVYGNMPALFREYSGEICG